MNKPVNLQIVATGGKNPEFSATGLPSGLTINQTTGMTTGTPTTVNDCTGATVTFVGDAGLSATVKSGWAVTQT